MLRIVLAMSAAIKQSGFAEPGEAMNCSESRMRRSPFMEVRFISPAWAAGNIRWAPAAESQSIELLLGVTAVVLNDRLGAAGAAVLTIGR